MKTSTSNKKDTMTLPKHESASGVIQRRILELEMILELSSDKDQSTHFLRQVKASLLINQELYAYLVNLSGDNLIH